MSRRHVGSTELLASLAEEQVTQVGVGVDANVSECSNDAVIFIFESEVSRHVSGFSRVMGQMGDEDCSHVAEPFSKS